MLMLFGYSVHSELSLVAYTMSNTRQVTPSLYD